MKIRVRSVLQIEPGTVFRRTHGMMSLKRPWRVCVAVRVLTDEGDIVGITYMRNDGKLATWDFASQHNSAEIME